MNSDPQRNERETAEDAMGTAVIKDADGNLVFVGDSVGYSPDDEGEEEIVGIATGEEYVDDAQG